MKQILRACGTLGLLLILSACGTTYQVPEPDRASTIAAQNMFAQVRSQPPRQSLSTRQAEKRFNRVASRIRRVGHDTCKATAAQLGTSIKCNVVMAIDWDATERNAYFTYDKKNRPVVMVTMPLLKDTASDDEVAFVLGHEYGHLIGQHIEKQQQQALVGALILGTIVAVAEAQTERDEDEEDTSLIEAGVVVGGAIGASAFSQTYELESDTLGTLIARNAGYDPVKGAQFFARAEDAKTASGALSFWGTHPPDIRRLATVIATSAKIDAQSGLALAQ